MEESKRGTIGNKGLLVTLIILVVAIIGLVVGVVVVSNKTTDGGDGNELVINEQEEEFLENADLEDMMASAEELVENNELAKMKVLYKKKLEQMIEEREAGYVILEFILSEAMVLSEAGYKNDALELMLDVDCNIFEDLNTQYVCLSQVSILAEELGRTDVVDDYLDKLRELGERTGIIILDE